MAFLDDAFCKLARADEHLRILEKDMRDKLDAKEYTITQQAQTEVTKGGSDTTFGSAELLDPPELPPEWALLIGDFAFNARASLDYLAWALTSRYKWREARFKNAKPPKPWPGKIYFPIYAYFKKPRDRKTLKTKLLAFSPTDRKPIAAAQPHKRGNLARAEPLWLLDCIRNTDAHRTLHPVLASVPFGYLKEWFSVEAVAGGGASFHLPEKFEVFRSPGLMEFPLKTGDVLDTTMQIKANAAPHVTFDQRGADFHGQEVLPLLHRCRDEIERILRLY